MALKFNEEQANIGREMIRIIGRGDRQLFFLEPDQEDLELLRKYAEHIPHYFDFCRKVEEETTAMKTWYEDQDNEEEPNVANWEESDFSWATVGWFVARGVPSGDAYSLNTFFRYTMQYFSD